jgi:hypothetical protein
MNIREISVGWSELVSLPGRCNVRPSLGYTAIVEEGESADEVRSELLKQVKTLVRAEIDMALEQHNESPKYYDGPRFQVLYSDRCKAVVIMPDDTNVWPETFVHRWGSPRGMRPQVAREKAVNLATSYGYDYYDCSDGNYDRLPPVPDVEEEELPF